MVKIKDSVILITGADGGIGRALVNRCLVLGAKKIYASGLKLDALEMLYNAEPRIAAIELDVTKEEQVKLCAEQCADTNILINNAAVELKTGFIGERSSEAALFEMNVNYIGLIRMINAFIPALQKNGQAGIVNILSLGALAIVKRLGTYCASKTAGHILTEAIRDELAEKNIEVMAAYMGYVDTNMVPEETVSPKASPDCIAEGICEGIENGDSHIIPDGGTRFFIQQNPIRTVFSD